MSKLIENSDRTDFSKGKMSSVMLRMSFPMIVAQVVNLLYNMVDRMFVGRIPETGSLALSALGLCLPLVYIITAFANMCGTGGPPLCSIDRGRGDTDEAERIMANTFSLTLIFGVILSVLLVTLRRPILLLTGAGDDTIDLASSYTAIYCAGAILFTVALGMNPFITAQGFPKVGMLSVTVGAVINIALDPLLIFTLGMGVRGAALATVISQAVSAVWVMAFLTGKRTVLRFRFKYMKPDFRLIWKICSLGFTGFVMAVTNGLVQGCSNIMLKAWGGDLYVGAMTVISSVKDVFFVMVRGLGAGAQPVLGFNYGARKYERVRAGIRFLSIVGTSYAVLCWAALMLFPGTFARIFSDDAAFIELCIPCMRVYSCTMVVMAFMSCGQNTFVGLGKAKYAVFFSLLRKAIIVTPLIFILPGVGGLGVYGVFLAEPISEVIASLACYITMMYVIYRGLRLHPEKI